MGSGTGLCGLMLAKAITNTHVYVTDLPELLNLMEQNLYLNFNNNNNVEKEPNNNEVVTTVMQQEKTLKVRSSDESRRREDLLDDGVDIVVDEGAHNMGVVIGKPSSFILPNGFTVDDINQLYLTTGGYSSSTRWKKAAGRATATTLRWGVKKDYKRWTIRCCYWCRRRSIIVRSQSLGSDDS